ncbi:hypothetical protein HS125_13530 [bacterium]|nr:hypothetical protein [bacterium]
MAARMGSGVLLFFLLTLPAPAALKLSTTAIPPNREAAGMRPADRAYYTQFLLNHLHGQLGVYANSMSRISGWRWWAETGEFEFAVSPQSEQWLRVYFDSLAGRPAQVDGLSPQRTYTVRYYSPVVFVRTAADLARRVAWTRGARARAQALFASLPPPDYGEPRRIDAFPWEGAVDLTADPALLARFATLLPGLNGEIEVADLALVFGPDNAMTHWHRAWTHLRAIPQMELLAGIVLDTGPLERPVEDLYRPLLSAGGPVRQELAAVGRAGRWALPSFAPDNPFTPRLSAGWDAMGIEPLAAYWRLSARAALAEGDPRSALQLLLDELTALSYAQMLAPFEEREAAARAAWLAARDAFTLYRQLRDRRDPRRPEMVVLSTLYRYCPRQDEGLLPPDAVAPLRMARAVARIVHLDAALGHFHARYGFYPAHPAELARRYFHVLPMDPFTGGPFAYQRVLSGYRLWSPGPDGAFDGRPASEPWSMLSWDGDLVLSNLPEGA